MRQSIKINQCWELEQERNRRSSPPRETDRDPAKIKDYSAVGRRAGGDSAHDADNNLKGLARMYNYPAGTCMPHGKNDVCSWAPRENPAEPGDAIKSSPGHLL